MGHRVGTITRRTTIALISVIRPTADRICRATSYGERTGRLRRSIARNRESRTRSLTDRKGMQAFLSRRGNRNILMRHGMGSIRIVTGIILVSAIRTTADRKRFTALHRYRSGGIRCTTVINVKIRTRSLADCNGMITNICGRRNRNILIGHSMGSVTVVTRIIAEPPEIPVTTPYSSTVATAGSLDIYVTALLSASIGVTVGIITIFSFV